MMNNKDFRSDNVCPPSHQILEATFRTASDWMDAYSDDQITARLQEKLGKIFEHDVVAFPVLTGTAANALALSQISGRFGQILCHQSSHIYMDECGAVEFYTQGNRLKPLPGRNGKLDPETCSQGFGIDDVHQLRTTSISVSQATEFGTYYSSAEISELGSWAKKHKSLMHMDGTRFANALVASASTIPELTWKAGVDVLCLGATKGGALGAEVVVFFEPDLALDFKRVMKRSGHLASRLWFLSSQLETYFMNDLWLNTARHANDMAKRLDSALRQGSTIRPCYPVEINMVFLRFNEKVSQHLQGLGFKFYTLEGDGNEPMMRFVMSHATTEDDVDRLAEAIIETYNQLLNH